MGRYGCGARPRGGKCGSHRRGRRSEFQQTGVQAWADFAEWALGACDVGLRSQSPGHLTVRLSWFYAPERAGASALVTFDQGFIRGFSAAELASNIRRRHTGAFAFGGVVPMDEPHRVRGPADAPYPDISLEPSGLGVSVVLPERTASAAGWVLATVVDVACVLAPETEDFAVRIAQIA